MSLRFALERGLAQWSKSGIILGMKKGATSSPFLTTPHEKVLGLFEQFFPAQVVQSLIGETKQRFYNRLLPPLLILWGFIYQRLNADHM